MGIHVWNDIRRSHIKFVFILKRFTPRSQYSERQLHGDYWNIIRDGDSGPMEWEPEPRHETRHYDRDDIE